MADLNALFTESGLQGIIPYAFGMTGQGYQYLCQKMREGIPFWVIASTTNNMPFVFAEGEKTYFSLYSTQSQAEQKCDELAMDKFYTQAAPLFPDGWAADLWKRYRDLGATFLRFDDTIWIDIRDLAPAATYDGLLNSKAPLRNALLNAALYAMMQFVEADIECDSVIAYFWRLFKERYLYVPVLPKEPLSSGQALDLTTTEYHIVTLQDGSQAFLAFTDIEAIRIYAMQYELSTAEYTAAYTPGFFDLKEFMMANPELPVIVNHCSGDFLFSLELFEHFELITLNQTALAVAAAPSINESNWEQ